MCFCYQNENKKQGRYIIEDLSLAGQVEDAIAHKLGTAQYCQAKAAMAMYDPCAYPLVG
jgi:hypothetical protein